MLLEFFILTVIALGASIGYYLYWYESMVKKTGTIGLGFIWFLQNRLALVDNIWPWIQQNKDKVTSFYHLFFLNRVAFIAATPDAAKFVLTSKDKFQKSFGDRGSYSARELFKYNLVAVDGADWRRQRTLYNPAFGTEAYKLYFPVFTRLTDKTLNLFEQDRKESGPVDVVPYLQKFTLDVLGLTIFDYDFGSLDGKINDYYGAYKGILQQGIHPVRILAPWAEAIPIKYFREIKDNVAKLKELFNKVIQERKLNSAGKSDILTHLIQASESEDQGLTQDELISNTFILFVAGHETTATALTWIIYELYQNPHIQQKLYEEIVQLIGEKEVPAFEDWDKLPYLNNVLSESLRSHPPVGMLATRKAVEDVDFEGVHIPKGSMVGFDVYNIHHDPNVWEKPFEFNPDRFLPENKKKMDRFAYLPFSLGPRQCIGNTFSLIEQHMFIIRLLQKYEILPPPVPNTLEKKTGLNSLANLNVILKPRY